MSKKIKMGIGFATGRKSFQDVLRAYVDHLQESDMLSDKQVELSLFVAYDLTYLHTKKEDYTEIPEKGCTHFTSCHFLGAEDIDAIAEDVVARGVVSREEAELCFGRGYAAQRNAVVYTAMKEHMDVLVFLDDDEYPMAVTQSKDYTLWSGQHVLEDHLKYLRFSGITNGYHCGYISPIPYMEFDNILTEDTFRTFIEALSNDILNWDTMRMVMENGGVTYADKAVLTNPMAELVEERGGAKFITGGNLGLNLSRKERVHPFYNPPGARGEDTFLSTCLSDVTVKRIPTYTFHDGFGIYKRLLHGVLPGQLRKIDVEDSDEIIRRFYNACIGWVRYKPLFVYITHREQYREIIDQMRRQLEASIPQICAYFDSPAFGEILVELDAYDHLVEEHYRDYINTGKAWERLKNDL